MQWMLWYEVGPDYLAKRAQYREQHLSLARKARDAGLLLAGGALTAWHSDGGMADAPQAAALYFQTDDPTHVAQFADADPYVIHGLVRRYQIFRWHTVAGVVAEQQL